MAGFVKDAKAYILFIYYVIYKIKLVNIISGQRLFFLLILGLGFLA